MKTENSIIGAYVNPRIILQNLTDEMNNCGETDVSYGVKLGLQWAAACIKAHTKRLSISDLPAIAPYRVGQKVWFIRNKEQLIETEIMKIIIKHGGVYLQLLCNSAYETSCKSIGKTIFFTEKDALRVLKNKEKKL